MGQIGFFGKEKFEVSGNKIFTPENIQRSAAGRFSSNDRIGLKPMTSFDGPGLDTVSFSIIVNATYGVRPRDTLDYWNALANAARVDVLVIGGKALSSNKWLLKSVSQSWDIVAGNGKVIKASIDLTFEEYVEK